MLYIQCHSEQNLKASKFVLHGSSILYRLYSGKNKALRFRAESVLQLIPTSRYLGRGKGHNTGAYVYVPYEETTRHYTSEEPYEQNLYWLLNKI